MLQIVENRKLSYMKEASGMRVERQAVLLKVEAIYKCFKDQTLPRRRKSLKDRCALDYKIQELIGMLRKDPERL